MKSYKLLVPIALIAIFVISVYTCFQNRVDGQEQYEAYLKQARSFAEQGILVDAVDNYTQALKSRPSLELFIEVGEFYKSSGETRKAQQWADAVLEKYPKEKAAYEFSMGLYCEHEDYIMCFDLYDTCKKRRISSEYIEGLMAEIEYEYFLSEQFDEVSVYSGGLCAVRAEEKWGYVNEKGSKVIPAQFEAAGAFIGERAAVVDNSGEVYFIDTQGNRKMNLKALQGIKAATFIDNHIFAAFDGNRWKFYDTDMNYLFGEYDSCSAMGNGIAAVESAGQWSLLDREGNTKTPNPFGDVIIDQKGVAYRNERLFALDGSYYYLVDSSGSHIGQQGYDDAVLFNDTTYAAVKLNGQWGFIDKNGNMVIEPQYEEARSFSNGFAAVRVKGKWGFINLENKMVIEPQFEDAGDFTGSGSVFVNNGYEWTLLRLYKFNH